MMTIDASETDDRKKKNKILPYENNMDEPDPTRPMNVIIQPAHTKREMLLCFIILHLLLTRARIKLLALEFFIHFLVPTIPAQAGAFLSICFLYNLSFRAPPRISTLTALFDDFISL